MGRGSFKSVHPSDIRSQPQNYVQSLVRQIERIGESSELMKESVLDKDSVFSLYVKVRQLHAMTVKYAQSEDFAEKPDISKIDDMRYEFVEELFEWEEKIIGVWGTQLLPAERIQVEL